MKKIFISFREEDHKHLDKLLAIIKNPDLYTFDYAQEVSEEEIKKRGKDKAKKAFTGKISSANVIICLVGENTHHSAWIDMQIKTAKSQRKPIVVVRIRNTKGEKPYVLRNSKEISWSSSAITGAINDAR